MRHRSIDLDFLGRLSFDLTPFGQMSRHQFFYLLEAPGPVALGGATEADSLDVDGEDGKLRRR